MPSLSEETNGRIERLMPGSTIGIIGGGLLGRMMALSVRYMGFRVGVLDPTPDCPTAQVADFQIVAEYDDKTAIHDLAVKSDVLTYEFENVDADAIDEVRGLAAVPQGTDLLRVTQDRVNEKQFINDHGTATAPWRAVNNFDELDAALDEIHYPAVLKTRSGGYDGRPCSGPTPIWNRFARAATAVADSRRAFSKDSWTSPSKQASSCPATARISSHSPSCATSIATTSCI